MPPPPAPPLLLPSLILPPCPSIAIPGTCEKVRSADVIKRIIQRNLQDTLEAQGVVDKEKVARELVTKRLSLPWVRRGRPQDIDVNLDIGVNLFAVSLYRYVQPIIQSGPSCGVAALCMAVQLISGETFELTQVLQRALYLDFTKQGEMFSAENLLRLAEDVSVCRGVVLDILKDCIEQVASNIVSELLRGSVILIPYDADFNHGPCLKKGHKAHWAVLTGLVYTATSEEVERLRQAGAGLSEDSMMENMLHVTSLRSSSWPLTENLEKVYVYGSQGKSAGSKLWELFPLLNSNRQLLELGPNITNNIHDFRIPCDISEGLCGKIIVLHPSDIKSRIVEPG